MSELKLHRLPDRTPVKLVLNIMPDLDRDLRDYAVAYREAYGNPRDVIDLVPHMLASFLASDRAFAKARSLKAGGERPS